MFIGNDNDSGERIITLVYPIVAKFVRFNPQRWNMVISMRVELTGCPYSECSCCCFEILVCVNITHGFEICIKF